MENLPLVSHEWVAVKNCRHGRFLYNRNDTFIGRSLDLYGEWCEAEIELLLQVVRPGDVVLDIGANIGTHTVPLARRVEPGGYIMAFEPQRLVFQMLCANMALNAQLNALCLQKAVGAAAAVVAVPVLDPRHPTNFGGTRLGANSPGKGELTELVAIDDLGLTACRLIKIDVEGMEVPVLEGAAETIRRTSPILYVENNRTDTSRGIIETLTRLGYRGWWHLANYYSPKNFFGNPDNVFAAYRPEANLLCLPARAAFRIEGLIEVSGPDDHWEAARDRINRAR